MKLYLSIIVLLEFLAVSTNAQAPHRFTENKGQITDQYCKPRLDILYSYFSQGLGIYFSKKGFSYQLFSTEKKPQRVKKTDKNDVEPSNYVIRRVDVSFFNSNTNCVVNSGKEFEDYDNYYTEKQITFVKSHKDLFYKSLYNGIDLHYYSKDNNIKYDFIVAPGADASKIVLDINGADNIKIETGKLVMTTTFGKIIEQEPIAYQGNKKIAVEWMLKGNKASFKITGYDKTKELIIDPIILVRHWGTYYGGLKNEEIYDLKLDQLGNIYASGYTESAQNIATAGTFQSSITGISGGFIVKFNSLGIRQWGTYLSGGNTSSTFTAKLAIDKNNDVYTVGHTDSTSPNITTPGAYQQNYSGGPRDAFYAKFNPSGIRLYATFYGGAGTEEGSDIVIDSNKNVYILGMTTTTSGSNIVTPSAFQTVNNGGVYDNFLAKFDSIGNRLWSTMYGGSGNDFGKGLTLDKKGDVYFFGYTSSQSNISTLGSHQPNFGGDFLDTYLIKFSSNGSRCWGTYYGGNNNELGLAITADTTNGIYIGGNTGSTALGSISTPGSYQPTKKGTGGIEDFFIAKFDTAGTRQWGTYYGGSNSENYICLSFQKNFSYLLVGGSTYYNSTDNPPPFASVGAHQSYPATGLYSIFDINGNRLHSSYYGGDSPSVDNAVHGIAMNSYGELYIGGATQYSNYYQNGIYEISTAGSHQPSIGQPPITMGPTYDGYIAKFGQCPVSISVTTVNQPTLTCNGDTAATIILCGSGGSNLSYVWGPLPPNTVTYTANNFVSAYSLPAGVYTCQVTNSCGSSATHTVEVTQPPIPNLTLSATPAAICPGDTSILTVSGAQLYFWYPGPYITNLFGNHSTIKIYPQSSINYTVAATSNTACPLNATGTINISVDPQFSLQLTPSITPTVCVGSSTNFFVSGASTYWWNTADTGNTINFYTYQNGYNPVNVVGTNSLGCKASQSGFVYGILCTSIQENSVARWNIFPNPTNGITHIPGFTTSDLIEVKDAIGRVILTCPYKGVIDLSSYSPGIYFLTIRTAEDFFKYKIVRE